MLALLTGFLVGVPLIASAGNLMAVSNSDSILRLYKYPVISTAAEPYPSRGHVGEIHQVRYELENPSRRINWDGDSLKGDVDGILLLQVHARRHQYDDVRQ